MDAMESRTLTSTLRQAREPALEKWQPALGRVKSARHVDLHDKGRRPNSHHEVGSIWNNADVPRLRAEEK